MYTAAGLFAGAGGIECGLARSGFEPAPLCEIMPEARAVLKKNFPNAAISSGVQTLQDLPQVDLLAAGFPCQNISLSGGKKGLKGANSPLVYEIFRLLEHSSRQSEFVPIKNVPTLITLNGGEILRPLLEKFSGCGCRWAYRLVDPRSFGIPQRRFRFILLASRTLLS